MAGAKSRRGRENWLLLYMVMVVVWRALFVSGSLVIEVHILSLPFLAPLLDDDGCRGGLDFRVSSSISASPRLERISPQRLDIASLGEARLLVVNSVYKIDPLKAGGTGGGWSETKGFDLAASFCPPPPRRHFPALASPPIFVGFAT